MPRTGSPYGPAYRRARARLLAGHPRCECGNPATEADHVPPLALHRHVEGSGCCVLRPRCSPCQRRQAIELCNLRLGRRSPYRETVAAQGRAVPAPSRSW